MMKKDTLISNPRDKDLLSLRLRLHESALSHTLEAFLRKSLDEVCAWAESPIGFFHFVESDQKTLSLQAWSTRTLKEFCRAEGKGMHYGIDRAGVWADCLRERRPVIHNDYASLPHRKGMPEGHAVVVRELVVPIMRAGRVVGILGVGNKATDYTPEDVEIVSFLADVVWNIVDHKRLDGALEESEARYRLLFDHMVNGFALHEIVLDQAGKPVDYVFLEANPAFERLTGLSRNEIIGRKVTEVVPGIEKEAADWIGRYGKVALTGRQTQFEHYAESMGKWFSVLAYSPQEMRFATIIADITEQKQAQKELVYEKERFRITLRSIGDGVITTDLEGKVALINQMAEELTGWRQEEAQGLPLGHVFHIINEDTREVCESSVETVLRAGTVVGLANHTILICRDGTERIIADSAAPIRDGNNDVAGVVLVFRDITDRVRVEEELNRNQKLESLGVLAGGIAHDFNNILTTIIGNISLVQYQMPRDDENFGLMNEALTASTRAQGLTKQLLTFAKGGAPVKETGSIGDLIKESCRFILRGAKSNCEFSMADDLWAVEVDIGQISQVIHNVVINADQAMPDGGIIRVAAENLTIEKRHDLPLKKGKYVKISIKDQGTGIGQDHLSKIFDPYFTTKQAGSGLGLATTHSVIHKHDGCITVESALGRGTTFHIYLPASEKAVPQKEEDKLLTGKGKVLVMDDEAPLRRMLAKILDQFGYEPEFAKDGVEAIQMVKEAKNSKEPYDAVILDLTIPGGMGGKQAIKKLIEIDPEIKAIVSSGYSDDPVMADFQEYGFKGSLAKPFDFKELARVLRAVMAIPGTP
ncbi:MAG: PAS domain S-box protein [Deltaproteobacteria bacterium]|nr:PAS domain S-box protein [Deltaproteobacteria bacterium]